MLIAQKLQKFKHGMYSCRRSRWYICKYYFLSILGCIAYQMHEMWSILVDVFVAGCVCVSVMHIHHAVMTAWIRIIIAVLLSHLIQFPIHLLPYKNLLQDWFSHILQGVTLDNLRTVPRSFLGFSSMCSKSGPKFCPRILIVNLS